MVHSRWKDRMEHRRGPLRGMLQAWQGTSRRSAAAGHGGADHPEAHGLSDRARVMAIAKTPYYQYFISLPSFSVKCPFTYSTLALFRRRISAEMLMAANESFLEDSPSTPEHRDAQPRGKAAPLRRLARTASREH